MILRRFQELSISVKITSLLVFVAAVALVLAAAVLVVSDRIAFREALARKLSAEAQIVGSNSTSALLFNDPSAARGTLAALAAEPHVVAAGIYDLRGRIFARYGVRALPPILPTLDLPNGEIERVQFEPAHVILLRRILSDGETVGFVMLDSNLTELDARLLWLSTLVVGVIGVALALAGALATRLQRLISRPVLDLADLARRISTERDYSARASAVGPDEIGVLGRSFNEMLVQIQKRESSLTAEIAEREKTQSELARARDAAEAARLREESARKAAEQASSLKSAFLANMSHEIRTPLNVILGYNSLIESELQEGGDETHKPLFEGVSRASKRLMNTVHGILDISRIESGAFDIHPAPIRLTPFVGRLVEDYRVLARSKSLELGLHVADEVTVVFDEYCLSHALTNLLDNAIKFTERGSITVDVAREAEGGVRIEIADTGIGMGPEYLAHVAEPFSQEQSGTTRRFEGSGLGLALTKRFLETHDATLTVTSEKGEGSRFVIRIPPRWVLPTAEEPIVEKPRVASSGNGAGGAPDPAVKRDPDEWAKPCVLVVEDDEETQDLMRAVLRDRYRVLTAASGEEARRQLGFPGQTVRLILMDLALRGDEDGLAFTRALRKDERWRTLPIVALTAHAMSEDRDNALRAGCDAYLSKPFERERLLSVVQGFTR